MTDRGEALRQVFGATHAHEEGLFAVSPDRVGFGILTSPLCGGDDAIATKLNLLLNLNYPAGTILQFCLYASPDISGIVDRYELMRVRNQDPVLREMSKQRVALLNRGVQEPMDGVTGTRLRNVRLVISCTLPSSGSALRKGARDEQLMAQARELAQTFEQTVKTIGFAYETLHSENYLRFMRTVMNHGPAATWRDGRATHWDPARPLCNQILDPDVAIDIDDRGLWLGDHARVKTMHCKVLPVAADFGEAMTYLGDYMTGQRGIREPALLTMNVWYGDHESARGRLEADHAWATRQASGRLAHFMDSLKKRKADLDFAKSRVDEGDRIVEAYLGMALFCRDEEHAVSATANARAYWRERGPQMLEDRYMVLTLFSQLLPLAADVDVKPSLMRYKAMPTGSVVPQLPVMGAWRGTGSPLTTLFARDGQIMAVSPWDSNTNRNWIVAGTTGSGKSFFVQEMLANFRATGGRVWVVDVGNSYRQLCEVLGGQYVQFGRASNLCINPFSLVRDFADEADMLATVLTAMAAPGQGLTDFQTQGLKRVLSACHERLGSDLKIDDIIEALKAEGDPRLNDVGQQLFSFSTAGEYGRYFNGKNNANLDNPFVVLELEELKQQPHLQRVVLLLLLYQIQQEMFMGDRALPKILAIDESWDLLRAPEMQAYIVALYRRVRKAGGSVGTISQNISDYWISPTTVAIVDNSANKYLLKQNGEAISGVEKEGRLAIGDWGFRLLRSVHSVRDEYSEIMCVTDYGTGVGRLVVSPFTRLLYSTAPEDVAALKRHRDRGLDVVKAIHAVLRERGQ